MQSIILSSGSTRTPNPTPGGIPPFSHYSATGADDLMSTQAGAQALASRIIDAWAIEGQSVDAWVVRLDNQAIHDRGQRASWGVRTDLVNGMPSGLGRTKWERKYGRGI
jgi:hypothetical protein